MIPFHLILLFLSFSSQFIFLPLTLCSLSSWCSLPHVPSVHPVLPPLPWATPVHQPPHCILQPWPLEPFVHCWFASTHCKTVCGSKLPIWSSPCYVGECKQSSTKPLGRVSYSPPQGAPSFSNMAEWMAHTTQQQAEKLLSASNSFN